MRRTKRRNGLNFGTYIEVYTASRGFHCDSTAFALNNRKKIIGKNNGKITALKMSIFLLLTSLFESYCPHYKDTYMFDMINVRFSA